MPFPEFFDAAPRITVRDPLARFLGAADDGVIEYAYADVVKLAGHSCPTVASAYVMTRAALAALYPDALPERGGIRVELRDDLLEGATGVIANVASFLTGATHDTGFKGIGGQFDRRNLLFFGVDIPGEDPSHTHRYRRRRHRVGSARPRAHRSSDGPPPAALPRRRGHGRRGNAFPIVVATQGPFPAR